MLNKIDSRTIAYETHRKQTVIYVRQYYQLDDCATVIHMPLPKVNFDIDKSFQLRKFSRKKLNTCWILCSLMSESLHLIRTHRTRWYGNFVTVMT